MNCKHKNTSRAWRDLATGSDYIVCTDCGKRLPSPIQFGGSTLREHAITVTMPTLSGAAKIVIGLAVCWVLMALFLR